MSETNNTPSPYPSSKRFINLTGQIFGRLTVIFYAGQRRNRTRWECLCECGNTVQVVGSDLRTKNTTSCGCATITTGNFFAEKKRTPGWRNWRSMIRRCTEDSGGSSCRYKDKGITVCAGLMESFDFFMSIIKEKPSPTHQIDRILGANGYWCGECPECVANNQILNIHWATLSEQARNKSNMIPVEYKGEKKLLIEWSEQLGLPHKTIKSRLQGGWSIERALEEPIKARLS